MLTVASLLAAMTIAGAFWVGVLAARRLRDWGEGRRALEEGDAPLALAAATGAPPDDRRSRRIRELVAQRLRSERSAASSDAPRVADHHFATGADELGLLSLRVGDVVVVDTGDRSIDTDYIVEGLVRLREGGSTTVVANLVDGSARRWLVGGPDQDDWLLVEPVTGHGLSGEPPRNIARSRGDYALRRRGQSSAACTGRHHRPELPRVATYIYAAGGREVLWLERWGDDVLVGEGRSIDSIAVSFLPGS